MAQRQLTRLDLLDLPQRQEAFDYLAEDGMLAVEDCTRVKQVSS